MSQRTWARRLASAAYWVVAVEFFVGAVTKYWPGTGPLGSDYAEKFTNWGYPSWFRFVVGTIELVSSILLVIPNRRLRFIGAVSLLFVLIGATTTHIVNHNALSESLAAPTHLLVAAVIALANWPARWQDLLRPTAHADQPATPPEVAHGAVTSLR